MKKLIAKFGPSRQTVRVFTEGDLVRVRYRDPVRRVKSWPNTKENRATAKAFAQGIAEGRETRPITDPLTLRQIWERFAEAEFPALRPKSKKLYKEYWLRWETMWGDEFIAERTTLDMANQFRAALTKQGKALSTIRHSLETVKMVYKWASKHELLERNKLALYEFKVPKESRVAPPPEYRTEDFRKILAKLDPNRATEWRAYVALSICGYQGVRQNSVLHLKWSDIDMIGGYVRWAAEWDKTGKEWRQPLRRATDVALACAAMWRQKSGHDGVWVLPSGSSKNRGSCYTIGALYLALRGAEERAGIKHLKRRGAHGLRRMLAGDIAAMTKDPVLAMRSIGDTDMKQASKYLQKRDDALEDAFSRLDKPEEAAKL
jgi:integrase